MHSTLKYLLVFLLFLSCYSSTNIDKLKVYQSVIFTKQEFVGNIPVDDKDNPLQKGYWLQHIIVIEVKENVLPKWESLVINGKENKVSFFSIHDTIFNIGIEKNTGNKVNFYPKNSGKLFLIKVEDYFTEIPLLKPEIILIGKLGEKTLKIAIKNEPIILETEARP